MGSSMRMIWRTPSATSRMPSKREVRPWLRCGSKLAAPAEGRLLPAASAAVERAEGEPRPTQASGALALPPPGRRLGATLRPQGGQCSAGLSGAWRPLAQVFDQMGVLVHYSPGTLSVLEERQRALSRIAQIKCTRHEPITVLNALRTWTELREFMEKRNRTTLEGLDLAVFIQEGTRGPARALNSLKWLSKAAQMEWNLAQITIPRRPEAPSSRRGQALVVEPGMLRFLGGGSAANARFPESSLDGGLGIVAGGSGCFAQQAPESLHAD